MNFRSYYFILFLLVLFLSVSCVSANEMNDGNISSTSDTLIDDNVLAVDESYIVGDELKSPQSSQKILFDENKDDIIVVNDWNELQYYCGQNDKDYKLKLKENTNFYPSNPNDANYQIKVKNNVKIYGSDGSYIGDNSSDAREIHFVAILVEDYSKAGLTLDNITFKWIKSVYSKKSKDGIFIQMGGIKNNVIRNCKFSDVKVESGHATIIYLKKGNTLLDNCSFINCTSEYGVVSVYDPNSVKSTDMIVRNCYFEGNYAETEPGCINNCGKLTVYNTTFVKNRSFWWAGAIHTHNRGNTTIYDSKFIDNVAGWNGGALYTYSYLQIYNSIFIGNNCTTNNGGGAIGACQYQSNPHIYIEKCLFKNNANNCWRLDELSTSGTGRGGAISLMDIGSIEVRDTTFVANSASIGTAICAIAVDGYGSPDIIIVNNSFINHTRVGDVLNVRVDGTLLNISNNQYYGNSIEFSSLTLTKRSVGKDNAMFEVNARLTNSNYYDSDILDKTSYDVYVNNEYVKTVNSKVFSVEFGDLDICSVYVIPTISNKKSNEWTVTSTREYIFVSKNKGNDNNNGITRDKPVNTISKALELASNCQNIILLDGDYSEENILVDYDVTIKGESGATLTNATSFIVNGNSFTLKNLNINNINTDTFIKQNNGNLIISNCAFDNNNVSNILDAKNTDISKSIFTNTDGAIVYNRGVVNIVNSILLNNSQVIVGNTSNINLDYNWWGNSIPNLNINHVLTLNVDCDRDSLENNQKSNVRFGFYLNDSEYNELPVINLIIDAVNGVSSKNVTSINSDVVYTLTAFEDGILTVSFNDFYLNKEFVFLKSNPNMGVVVKDVILFEDVLVQVNFPNDISGNLTVTVGNKTQNVVISSNNFVLTFNDLVPDCYPVCVNYSGDRKYSPQIICTTVNVNKYESKTTLNIGDIEVGEDLTLTVTTNDGATGNVTLSINDEDIVLNLTNSIATYVIKNIERGDYLIKAVYNGDSNYKESRDSKFIEVDNLNATMSIEVANITYGEVAIVKVTLNNNASGQVIVTVDNVVNSSDVVGGIAEVKLYGVDAGVDKNIIIFYTGDNNYFNLTMSTTFTVNKADLIFNISSSDIKIGQNGEIVIQVPQKTVGTFTFGDDVVNIPLSGVVSYVISDLEIGNYTYTATYNGNNYNTVSKSTSFEVTDYSTPMWSNQGANTQNTQKSDYATNVNGNVLFTIPVNETIIGGIVIDSLGNIYFNTQSGIYGFNTTRQLWYFTSNDTDGNLSGISISRDVIIAPKSGDTLYFINQTTGERWGESNIYQGSSLFSPVVDANSNLYIVSEYQYTSEDYKLTFIPYKLWANGGDPTLVSIGNTPPLCSPSLDENVIVIISDNRLRLINTKTLETISIKSGNFQGVRPVIGEGSIVYAILSNSIVAYNSNGVQVWKTRVTGGVGNTLAIDVEQAVYHINAKGLLYKYGIVDGSESKVSDLKVTSGLLIGSDGTLYFGSNNMFYALDSEGNILWKSDLNAKIIGNPVMDVSGLIYVPTENGVVALTHADLKDSDLKIQVDDIVECQKATVTITWNGQATGIITCNVNGEEITANADDLKITKGISGLGIGYYDVEASYSGDMRFKPTTITKTFAVRATDDVANNIQFDGNSTFTFSLNNAKGNLTVKINDKTYSKVLSNGNATITVNDLAPGDYDALVIYSGDGVYNGANRTFSLSVPKFNVTLNEQITTENLVSRISVSLPSDASGNLTLSVGTKKYTQKVTNGNAVIIVDDLVAGNYIATLTYSGDAKYESASKSVSINPTKITVVLDDTNVIVESGLEPKVSIMLNGDATGSLTVSVDGEEYSANLVGGSASVDIDLNPGNYSVTVVYSGDRLYSKASKTVNIEVPKIKLELNESTLLVSSGKSNVTFALKLPSDVEGSLIVSFNGKNYTETLTNGMGTISFNNLDAGNYEAVVTYSGSDKYESISKISTFAVSMVEITIDNDTLTVISPSAVPVISIMMDGDVTGNITVIVDYKEFKAELVDGRASLNITGLSPGSYRANVIYSGDSKYATFDKLISLEVPKINLDLNDLVVISNVSVPVISVDFKNDATGTLTVNVNGKKYSQKVINGKVSLNITGLVPGNYSVNVTYSGDNNYTDASKAISFEVPKINAGQDSLIVDANDDMFCFSVDLPSDATGTLTVTVDGINYTEILVDGKATINLADLTPGSHDITVTYSGDEKYGPITKISVVTVNGDNSTVIDDNSTNATVEKVDPVLVVNVDDINVGESAAVNVKTSITGKLVVNVNNKDYELVINNGISSLSISDLSVGNYEVVVRFAGDDRFNEATNSTSFRVLKVNLPVTDETIVIPNDNSGKYSISLPDDATGTLTVTVDGKDYTETLINGKATVNVPELGDGAHNITVTYSGDGKYESIAKSGVVNVVNNTVTNDTVVKFDSTIVINVSDVNVGEDVVVNVRTSMDSGKLVVNVNSKDYELVISNGESSLTIIDLAVGNYTVIAGFAGDEKFNATSNSTSFRVLKVTLPVTDETIVIPEDNSGVYSISLPEDATGTLTVNVDGKEYTQTLINGKATVNIPELSEGSHNITVTYSGDGKYEPITKTGVVSVNGTGDNSTVIDNSTNATDKKIDPVLIVSAQDINVGETAIVNVKTSIESGKIVVSVNSKDYELVVGSGESSISISDLAVGNYIVVARFAGDDRFNEAENSTSFSVLKVNVPVTNETISIPEDGDSTSYSISLPSDATGTLTVTVDGKEYTETLVNGKATVNIPELATGTHNITVKYSGDGKYAPITQSGVVTKEPVVKLTGSNLVMLYTSGKYFKVRLTGDGQPLEGKTVKITINGKTYTRTTNANGYASVKIKFAPKTYQATAVYGDLKLTKKVTVKSIISAKNVNAKKSAKSLKVKVSLKKVNGKYLKNKKVTLKFNKKTYKLKTNKKGVVTFTIKKNVYSKLKLNKKYTYKVTYGKNTVKKTIKFKK